jgi:hypothetical protein
VAGDVEEFISLALWVFDVQYLDVVSEAAPLGLREIVTWLALFAGPDAVVGGVSSLEETKLG